MNDDYYDALMGRLDRIADLLERLIGAVEKKSTEDQQFGRSKQVLQRSPTRVNAIAGPQTATPRGVR